MVLCPEEKVQCGTMEAGRRILGYRNSLPLNGTALIAIRLICPDFRFPINCGMAVSLGAAALENWRMVCNWHLESCAALVVHLAMGPAGTAVLTS